MYRRWFGLVKCNVKGVIISKLALLEFNLTLLIVRACDVMGLYILMGSLMTSNELVKGHWEKIDSN